MDIATDNQKQTISDDQELAKALAGVTEEANSMNFEETGTLPTPSIGIAPEPVAPPAPVAQPVFEPAAPVVPAADPGLDPGLANVKQAALTELRPLIDKLDVEPEEKFNTYLLLIRSTDDKDLIAPAHEAAKAIVDETKKAQALLDIIKEIDFLSAPKQ